MKKIVIYLIFTVSILAVDFQKFDNEMETILKFSQNHQDQSFTKNELKEDFELFKVLLKEVHPNLEIYMEKGELDKIFEKAESNLFDNMQYFTFYNILTMILDKINDSNLMIQHNTKERMKIKDRTIFPLQMKLLENNVYNISKDTDIPFGAQILSINEMDIDSILNELAFYTFTDGNSIPYKYRNIESYLNFVKIYYSLYGEAKSFVIKYKFKNRLDEKKIPAKHFKEVNLETKSEKNEIHGISYKRLNSKTHYMSLTGDIKLDDAIEEFALLFDVLKRSKAENLLLDIRNYTDGNRVILFNLLSYLIDDNIESFFPERFNNQEIPYKKHLVTGTDLNLIETELKNSYFKTIIQKYESNVASEKIEANKKLHYDRMLYVLGTSSIRNETVRFLSLLEYYTESIYLGEETKGGALLSTNKPRLIYELPNTKIKIGIPDKAIELEINQLYSFGRGVVPDYIIRQNYEDYLNGIDSEMEFVLNMIQEKYEQDALEKSLLETIKEMEEKELENQNIIEE